MKTVVISTPSGRITDPGLGYGVKVHDGEGNEIHGITSVDIAIRPDDVVKAEIELFAVPEDVRAAGHFMVMNPQTGELLEVSRIEFANGEAVDL